MPFPKNVKIAGRPLKQLSAVEYEGKNPAQHVDFVIETEKDGCVLTFFDSRVENADQAHLASEPASGLAEAVERAFSFVNDHAVI